jgi:DNA-binding MarR family transcriptional regulator
LSTPPPDYPTPRAWLAAPHADPSFRHWRAEWVVHHAASNDTYRLNDKAGRVLLALRGNQPQTVAEVAAEAAVDVAAAAQILRTLEGLGFATSC